jgi:hypothetical protein
VLHPCQERGVGGACSRSAPSSKATIAFGEEFLYELKATIAFGEEFLYELKGGLWAAASGGRPRRHRGGWHLESCYDASLHEYALSWEIGDEDFPYSPQRRFTTAVQ